MNEMKEKWMGKIKEISEKRGWCEVIDHFTKHLNEMEHLDSIKNPDRAIKKAFSLFNLSAIAISKMGVEHYFFEFIDTGFPYEKLVERLDAHEQFLKELEEWMEKERERVIKEWKERKYYDDDTD